MSLSSVIGRIINKTDTAIVNINQEKYRSVSYMISNILPVSAVISKELSKFILTAVNISNTYIKSLWLNISISINTIPKLNRDITKQLANIITVIGEFNIVRNLIKLFSAGVITISESLKMYVILLNIAVTLYSDRTNSILRLFYESIRKMFIRKEIRTITIEQPKERTINEEIRVMTIEPEKEQTIIKTIRKIDL